MSKLIMHIDMDAFFAAVEQRDNPELVGKPVIIGALPGNRGVVSTCSYEARKFGVHSGMPVSVAFSKCPKGIFLRTDGHAYSEASRIIMEKLTDISPVVEPVSVDEAYLDISGLERVYGDALAIANYAKRQIFEATKLTASVGIGHNRLIAKLGSDFNKPDGITIVKESEVLDFLYPMKVSCIRGAGKVLQKKLKLAEIYTVGDLRKFKLEDLIYKFGESQGKNLYRQARGIASDVVGIRGGRKSISKETTFNVDVLDSEKIRETVKKLAASVGRTARKKNLLAGTIYVKIRLSGFDTYTRRKTLTSGVSRDEDIFFHAWELILKSGLIDKPVRLIGVGISDWKAKQQMELFAESDKRGQKLTEVKDQIMDKFGFDAIGIKRKK